MKNILQSLLFSSLLIFSFNQTNAQAVTDSTHSAVARTTNYDDHENHGNWGLLGLIGLIGLAGLSKKVPVVERKVDYRDNQPR